MRPERLAQLIEAHHAALSEALDGTSSGAQATILGILQALAQGELTLRRAQHLLGHQALLASDEPLRAALYREAARELRRLEGADQ